MRQATTAEILEFLHKRASELIGHILVHPVQLSFPAGGCGPRVKVSVKRGERDNIPATMQVEIGGESVVIPLDVMEDYENIRLLNHETDYCQ